MFKITFLAAFDGAVDKDKENGEQHGEKNTNKVRFLDHFDCFFFFLLLCGTYYEIPALYPVSITKSELILFRLTGKSICDMKSTKRKDVMMS